MSKNLMTEYIEKCVTALFSPATRPDRVAKALVGGADLVIADLEDAVAFADKEAARYQALDVLTDDENFSNHPGIVIRINEPLSNLGQADLEALESAPAGRLAVMAPKAQSPADIDAIVAVLGSDVPVIALIESAPGLLRSVEIARHPNVVRLALGTIDLSAQLGCEVDSLTAQYARAQLVIASAAAELPGPLDSPIANFRDHDIISDGARSARRLGLGGMLCIHPAQLSVVAAAFAPSSTDVEWAERVVQAADGATAIDGHMIDRPVILRAEAILASRRT